MFLRSYRTLQKSHVDIIIGLCIVWMIRYDTYRDTFDPIHNMYRRYVSDQIYDITRHIFDKLVCTVLFITSALLRLECSIDCISGSVDHHQQIFPLIFWQCQLFHTIWRKTNFPKKLIKKNWDWVTTNAIYKLVLGPTPILNTNFHENPLTTFRIPRHLKMI